MTRFINKLAILAKAEASYGLDSVPTGAANFMQVGNVTASPFEGDSEDYDRVSAFFGHQGTELVGSYMRLQFDVELAGSGVAGTAPKWGPLLRACGFQEAVTAGVKTEYTRATEGIEAASIYYGLDGIRHVMVGTRGKASLTYEAKRRPKLRFDLMGLLGPVTDAALPTVTKTGWPRGRAVSNARTQFTLGGLAAPMSALSIDLGQKVEPRFLVNLEEMAMTDGKATGSVTVDAPLLAVKDWQAIAAAGGPDTTQVLFIEHGIVAGDIVTVDGPVVQIGRPAEANSNGVAQKTLPLMFLQNAGNDDIKITVK